MRIQVPYVLSEHGIYYSYKNIFKEDLEKIEELFGEIGSEKEAAKKLFLSPVCDYMKNDGFTVRGKVREGHVVEEILDEINEERYDMVMLGDKKGFSPVRIIARQYGIRGHAPGEGMCHGDKAPAISP